MCPAGTPFGFVPADRPQQPGTPSSTEPTISSPALQRPTSVIFAGPSLSGQQWILHHSPAIPASTVSGPVRGLGADCSPCGGQWVLHLPVNYMLCARVRNHSLSAARRRGRDITPPCWPLCGRDGRRAEQASLRAQAGGIPPGPPAKWAAFTPSHLSAKHTFPTTKVRDNGKELHLSSQLHLSSL